MIERMSAQTSDSVEPEFTIDELASRVGMTVRNVRAYAGRGIIPPPRLKGRTGYYSSEHEKVLRLVRDLIDQGYTLSAIEDAIGSQDLSTLTHTVDLLSVLQRPVSDEEPEIMTLDALAALAGTTPDGPWLTILEDAGLIEPLGDGTARVPEPEVVRAGAAAIRTGLPAERLRGMVPVLREHLGAVADEFVEAVRHEIWAPFAAEQMPDEKWPAVLQSVETLIPVASQAVLAVFRRSLSEAIGRVIEEEAAQQISDAATSER